MASFSFQNVTKSQVWQVPSLRGPLFFSLTCLIVQITTLVLYYSQLPPQVPLFYSLPWGTSQLTSPPYLWLLPGISFIILIFNWLLSHSIADKFSHQLLWTTTALICLMASYTLIQILLITI